MQFRKPLIAMMAAGAAVTLPFQGSAQSPGGRVVGGLTLLAAAGETPGGMSVPMELQLSLFKRIWAFDRTHAQRVMDELVVAVVYQEVFPPSLLARDDFVRGLTHRDWGPADARIVDIEIGAVGDIEATLREQGVDIVYLTPLRAVGVDAVVEATRRRRILTCTGVARYVADGVSLGVDVIDGLPRILVNLPAAKAEGADFSSELLKLADLVRQRP